MVAEISYMFGIVIAGFAVNYLLRALPFVLFAGRDRALPRWVVALGDYVSPVIIGALVVYSFATLLTLDKAPAYRTCWPYIAGVVTVGLQLWKRNPLASIVVGTVLYMCLLNCGCTSTRSLRLDARNPSIRITPTAFMIDDEKVEPSEIPDMLKDAGVPAERAIHVLVDSETMKDLRPARIFMAYLAKNGYPRTILVTERHAESAKKPSRVGSGLRSVPQAKPTIRYKGANE